MMQTMMQRPAALAPGARCPAARLTRRSALVCRAESTTSTSTPASPATASSDEDVKIKTTLSSLDALLGTPAQPAAPVASTSTRAPAATPKPAAPAISLPKLPTLPASPAAPKGQPSFGDLMGFAGYAPEVINGRAAMIGFLAAFTGELRAGESVFSQMVSGGLGQMLIVILAVTVASFAPAISGQSWDKVFNQPSGTGKTAVPTEWGPFTRTAEVINGRAAMIGIAVILFFEGAGNAAFFL